MSLYFLCRNIKLLNSFSRRKRFASLVITYSISLILFLLSFYDISIILVTGNPEYSTYYAWHYIPLFHMVTYYTFVYSAISSWAISSNSMLLLSLLAGAFVSVTLLTRISLNLTFLGIFPETYVDTA